jgi:hypothetical protein
MEKTTSAIVLALAVVILMVVFGLAARKASPKKIKSYILFIGFLLIAAELGEYYILNQSGPDGVKISESEKLSTNSANSNNILFKNSNEWKFFKEFWQQLDSLEYKVDSPDRDFFLALEAKQKTAIEGLKNLTQEKQISPVVIDLLDKICTERIQYIRLGPNRNMMTRMMPSQISLDKDASIVDLEKRIDMIIKLKANGSINGDEFNQAMANAKEDVAVYSLLDVITSHYGSYDYGNGSYNNSNVERPDMKTVAQHINNFEKHYADYLERKKIGDVSGEYEFSKGYEETKLVLDQVKEVLPLLDSLIGELESR